MDEYYISTDALAVGYNGKALIHDITVGFRRGEIVTLVGPNGSGKSTILKSITRQLKTVGGRVWVQEDELEKLKYKSLATKMAVVLTERLKPELMTCRDVVATGRYPYTGRLGLLTAEDEAKVTAAMEQIHALELADLDFDTVSDGQRQRVLLARAICQEPEIIVLDEPTSYLDIRHKLEFLSILRTMAKEKGITVVMSLHEVDLAQKVSDQVVCVRGEVISRVGPPEEVFTEPVIRELYDLEEGTFDADFGSVELPRPQGDPQVLVIAGCGTGIPLFRRLQKENTPFIAGILYTNDMDYSVARHLAAQVIEEVPYQEISDAAMAQAEQALERCSLVIDTGAPVGTCNRRVRELLARAERQGKLCSAQAYMHRSESA